MREPPILGKDSDEKMQLLKKLALFTNAGLMGFVAMMVFVFAHYGVTYMVYHSIPTLAMYIFFFYLINRRMDIYVWLVYTVIIVYMIAATLCLGYNYGFHLYCLSLIPLTFYFDYIAYKLDTRRVYAMQMSMVMVVVYLVSSTYAIMKGPVYQIDGTMAYICLNVNAISVFIFLIGFTSMLYKLIVSSETQLSNMANTDPLTGLFNRHYMMGHLTGQFEDTTPEHWVAMVDIDDFKSINDTYGHACGDHVLVEVGKIMRELCDGCVTARWGGEEFLISGKTPRQELVVPEALTQAVASRPFSFHGNDVTVTVTVGTAYYEMGQSLDSWIQSADKKLYSGKNAGKNQVVY